MSALAVLLDTVAGHVRRYVVLSELQSTAVAFWIAHSHAIEAATCTPYLNVCSAEKESGKTLLLEVMRPLVARPWFTGRVSAAALARKIDAETPTLLLDESDTAFGGDRDYAEVLRGVLNSGYRRGGAYTVCVGQGAKLAARDFSTFGPKAIAGLDRLPDTVASRSIEIRLKRRAADEQIERHRERDVLPKAAPHFDSLTTWADHPPTIEQLADARPEIPDELSDRAADVWEPLLAIADLAGEGWAERARRAAITLSGRADSDEDTIGIRLLADCREAFDGRDRLRTRELLEHLHGKEEAPWADWYGKPLTARKLADLLRRYEIRSRKIRFEDKPLNGFERATFEDAWTRYLPNPFSNRNNGNNRCSKPQTALLDPEREPERSGSQNGHKPHEQAEVPLVPGQGRDPGARP